MTLAEFLNPSPEQVNELRQLFKEKLVKDAAKIPVGGFHEHDMKWVFEGDGWLIKFLENNDIIMKDSLKQLWETLEWRKASGINEIREDNIRMEYVNDGLMFPRGRDLDGKTVFIFKSKLYVRGSRNLDDLKKCFLYWIERIIREANDDLVTIVFDLTDAGLSNVDMDYTKYIINTLKNFYPCSLNYILIYDLPWILNATFQIIKKLLPAKAVDRLRNINSKNIREYIDEDNMQKCWGGKDEYVFTFVPESRKAIGSMELQLNHNNNNGMTNGFLSKKVHFANLSPPESPMNESATKSFPEHNEGEMLRIKPQNNIIFAKSGNELVGSVEITNVDSRAVSYKVKTTAPEKFRVRPSTGVLLPSASVTINVALQHGHQVSAINREKFLVMCMGISNELSSNPTELAELWKITSAKSASVEQHRLKCALPVNYDESGLDAMFASTGTGHGTEQYGGPTSAGYGSGGGVRGDQLVHLQQTISHLSETTHRLEGQVRLNQKLQWITCILFMLLSVAIVYILKVEIKANATATDCDSMEHH